MTTPGFITTPDTRLTPTQRVKQTQVAPQGVPAAKLNAPWVQMENAIASLFGVARTYAGFETVSSVNPAVPNAAFYIGNAAIDARYIKQNQLVTIYVRFTIGTTTVINNLTEDAFGATQGNVGVMTINLPFPAAPVQPFALSAGGFTLTTQAPSNALSHTAFSGFLLNDPLDPRARTLSLISGDSWEYRPKAPAVYNPNGSAYWSAGDYMELQLEYETDYDG